MLAPIAYSCRNASARKCETADVGRLREACGFVARANRPALPHAEVETIRGHARRLAQEGLVSMEACLREAPPSPADDRDRRARAKEPSVHSCVHKLTRDLILEGLPFGRIRETLARGPLSHPGVRGWWREGGPRSRDLALGFARVVRRCGERWTARSQPLAQPPQVFWDDSACQDTRRAWAEAAEAAEAAAAD